MDAELKQKFLKLLEYQKNDIELRKLNTLIERDEAVGIMNKYRRAFAEAKSAIAECDAQSGALLDAYGELQRYIDDNEALLAELENAEEPADEKELEQRVKRLESLKSKFQSADNKIHDIDKKARAVTTRRSAAVKSGNAARQKHNEAHEQHDKLVASKADEVKRLQSVLEKMRSALDPELFAEYNKLVSENKFPPVVHAAADDRKGMFNCGGCGLNLSQKGNAALQTQGWFRCENCHRMVILLD